jgi:hypothetical protein
MTSKRIGILALTLGGLVGCGQISYFTVTVEVKDAPGRDRNKLSQIVSAEVLATGAISDEPSFLLNPIQKSASYNYEILSDGQPMFARFQYGTTKESGRVDFQVDLHNGTLGPDGVIASGTGGGDIKAGGSAEVTVMVTANSKY